jgi:hypothetical protein
MYKLSGFIKIDDQINNVVGVTSMIGELSTYCATFSKEKGYYMGDYAPGISFISFTSRQNNNQQIAVVPSYSEHVLQVAHRAVTYSRQMGQNVTTQDIANDLFNQFPNLIFDMETGPMVSTATLSMPEWISWNNSVLSGGDNRIKIWFSDQAFKRQYDDYEIAILNPVDDLMDLMREPSVTQAALDDRTHVKTMELIAQLKDGYPETILRAQTYTLINLLQPNRTFSVTWYAIVYGAAGDNPDIIKENIIAQLAQVGVVSLEEWRQTLPALFMTTEFTLIPSWLEQAIPDRTTQAGIYSPISNVRQMLNKMVDFYNDIDSEHVENYLQCLTVPYRSLTIHSLSGQDNINDLYALTDVYPDLINVGTSSQDFSRMSKKTQAFAIVLEEMIIIAENEEQYAELPTHTRRITRYNKTWITRNHDGIQFLIYAKSNDV